MVRNFTVKILRCSSFPGEDFTRSGGLTVNNSGDSILIDGYIWQSELYRSVVLVVKASGSRYFLQSDSWQFNIWQLVLLAVKTFSGRTFAGCYFFASVFSFSFLLKCARKCAWI